jgi:hypothetical protein
MAFFCFADQKSKFFLLFFAQNEPQIQEKIVSLHRKAKSVLKL